MMGSWFLKAYALTHDPPHKALWFEGYKIHDYASHEEEGVGLFNAVFSGMGFGGVPGNRERNIVRFADALASSFDRWALPYSPANYWAKAKYMMNPFNYDKRREVWRPPPDEFRRRYSAFINEVRRLLEEVKRNESEGDENRERNLYFTFYAAYEIAWIRVGLPVLPADTRAPTHTIFDHLYATAAVMNWVRDRDRLGGCMLVVDVPGIQSLIGSARKAGDYRAGSLLVSLAVWGTAWRFMERYGPDVLLSPTPRFNPLFYAQLDSVVSGVWGLYEGAMSHYLQRRLRHLGKVTVGGWLRGLVRRSSLFPGTLYLALPECNEDEAYGHLEKVLEEILEAARGGASTTLPIDLGELGEEVRRVVEDGLAGLGAMPYLPVRVAAVHVEEGLEGLERWVGERYRVSGVDVRRFLFARLMEMVNERKKATLPRHPAWFNEEGQPKFSKTYAGTWTHSSLDPSQPAVVKFGGVFKDGRLTYDEETREWLKSMGIENGEALGRLARVFKPKEALGPIDLIRRTLYLRSSGGLGVESVEKVALEWYHRKGYLDRCLEVKRLMERVLHGEDVEEVFGSSEEAEKRLAECKGEVTPGLEYVIIRADGDYVGEILNGCLPKPPRLPLDIEVVGDRKQFEGDMENAMRLVSAVQASGQDLCKGGHLVVPSPAYYAAVSAALMVTAIGDAAVVDRHMGELVFAGGDDLLAFSAKPPSFDIAKETRDNYWGEDGFHYLSDAYFLPALAAYGRSYSLRAAHAVTDMMSLEVDAAAELLDRAKDKVEGKDALVLSTSTGHVGFTKMGTIGSAKAIAEAYASGELSKNLPYDVEAWRKAAEVEYALRHIVRRNTKKKELVEVVVEAAMEAARHMAGQDKWKNVVGFLKALRAWA